jgi:hypothetical protein
MRVLGPRYVSEGALGCRGAEVRVGVIASYITDKERHSIYPLRRLLSLYRRNAPQMSAKAR